MNEITIIKSENIRSIISAAPQSYDENIISHNRCIEVGTSILQAIETQGMNDELDLQAANFLERARKTVRKMNDKRSPVTKLFDEIRSQFIQIENDVDPTKKDSVPYRLQQLRNEYAAKKRAEEERRQQEILRRQRHEQAIKSFGADVESYYQDCFNAMLNSKINKISEIFVATTLENFSDNQNKIEDFATVFPESWLRNLSVPSTHVELSPDDIKSIKENVINSLSQTFAEIYTRTLKEQIDNYSQRFPSKRKELEEIAKSNAEEAERRRREMEEKEAAERLRREEYLRHQEEERKKQAEIQRQVGQIGGLFDKAQSEVAGYQPKTSVKKKLIPLNPDAFMQIVSTWWAKEGQEMSVEELSKVFKKQLSFCEKLANDEANPVFIKSEHILYEDDVKAK